MTLRPWEEHLARERGRAMADITHHWGDAYKFTWSDGQFHAERRDNGAVVHAATIEKLWKDVKADYLANPVPRNVRVEAESGPLGRSGPPDLPKSRRG